MTCQINFQLIQALRNVIPAERVLVDEPMVRRTTFRIGGNADIFVLPASIDELLHILQLMKEYAVPLTILGNGSNVLVRDGGIRGIVVSFGKPFATMEQQGTRIIAGAGATLGAVSLFAASRSLSGLEFAVGIPGSLGGAVFMNAGAYDSDISQVVRTVTAMTPEGEIIRYRTGEMAFSYRHSVFQENGQIICEIELELKQGNPDAIQNKMTEFTKRRTEKQPLDKPSAGSTFKRPPGHFAGTLIDEAGLKGLSVGGAQISEKHAGFVINKGGATAADVLALIGEVQRRIEEKNGIYLTPEVRIIGEDT
ncbi:MAG: UDP-N-acetylmuramate dehydrogenase [Schwartzia sp.]|nr:UDP-N-acetylmuramate dehydrogenase [Schwartzia sp. (in: firmicutes)]